MNDQTTTTSTDNISQFDIDTLFDLFLNNREQFLVSISQYSVEIQKEILSLVKTDVLGTLYEDFKNVLPPLKDSNNNRLFDIGKYIFDQNNNLPPEYKNFFLDVCEKVKFIENELINLNIPTQIVHMNHILSDRYSSTDTYVKIITDGELAKVILKYMNDQLEIDQKFLDDINSSYGINYINFENIESYKAFLIHFLYRIVLLEELAVIASNGSFDGQINKVTINDLLPIIVKKILENNSQLYLAVANPEATFSQTNIPAPMSGPINIDINDVQLDIG
jgi:hypothetical protein